MSRMLLDYQKRIFYLGSIFSSLLYFLTNVNVLSIPWIACACPFLISLMIVPGITYVMISKDCPKIDSFSFGLLLFCSINISMFTSLFIILLSLHLDNTISASWYSIFISLWYAFLIYFIMCIFLTPGLFAVQMKREALLIISWGLLALVTSILIALCAENHWENDWVVFLPFAIIGIGSIFIYVQMLFNDWSRLGREGLFYTFIMIGVIIGGFGEKAWIFVWVGIYLVGDWALSEFEAHAKYKELE
ncbi:hypothetical protein SteCoe_20030 [Stentor coeruleus]|uniref:Uncharacterized protein n=1 Tax=Stentor coeruleus TaxID=5963 RepID=A0A1R2BTC5_9CILI|nr:hypothetical protein SteCoe_20030 [Stentor coeruleus]